MHSCAANKTFDNIHFGARVMELHRQDLGTSVQFPPIFCAPGARGFYGEGYPAHRILKYFGMTWESTGLAIKTVTLNERPGNMPLKDDGVTPNELMPRCIVVKPISGHMLNAVGLSNNGVRFFLDGKWWSKIQEPFLLSFMAVRDTPEERVVELREFVSILDKELRRGTWAAPIALQINHACPNAGVHTDNLAQEVWNSLEEASVLGIPLVINFNPLVPLSVLLETSRHPACSGFWIANTIPWGTPGIPWRKIFGTEISPLLSRGFKQQGGLSGPTCLPFTTSKVAEAQKAGINLPIIAGNGIQTPKDVVLLKEAGASGIAIGCVATLRPWRMRGIIRIAHKCFD